MQTTTVILESAEMADGQSSIASQLAHSIFVSAGTGFLPLAGACVVRESSKIVSLARSNYKYSSIWKTGHDTRICFVTRSVGTMDILYTLDFYSAKPAL